MGSLEKAIHDISSKAPGRCTTCLHCFSWDVPDKTRHWCRAFACKLDDEARLQVRDCPRWRPFAPYPVKRERGYDPEITKMIEAEDRLFWRAKQIVEKRGLCLKTLVAIAHPAASASSGDLDWIDDLDRQFEPEPDAELQDTINELKAYGYFALAAMIETAESGSAAYPTAPPVPANMSH